METKTNSIKETMNMRNRMHARTYDQKVNCLIREKYTVDQEFAILRQRDVKMEEFSEYNLYCEECKTKVKNGTFDKELKEYRNKQREAFKNMLNRNK